MISSTSKRIAFVLAVALVLLGSAFAALDDGARNTVALVEQDAAGNEVVRHYEIVWQHPTRIVDPTGDDDEPTRYVSPVCLRHAAPTPEADEVVPVRAPLPQSGTERAVPIATPVATPVGTPDALDLHNSGASIDPGIPLCDDDGELTAESIALSK